MKLDEREIRAVIRRIEEAGGTVLSTRLPDAAPTVAAHAPGRHEFTVPGWRPATLNEMTKCGNHFSAAALKKRDRLAVAKAVLAVRTPRAIRKRRVSVEVTMAGRMRPVDPDAIHKSLLDALVAAGLLVDDSPAWVEIGPFVQVRGAEKATKIVLEDIDEP